MSIEKFKMLEPMKYYNNENDCPKRNEMLDNKDNQFMAGCKKDGDWAMLIHYSKGHNLIRSRSISKVTGVYGDYTAKLPHICEVMDLLPDETVLLAELCWDEPGTNANTVGTILRCLPPKAIERQKDKKLKAIVFDLLAINGEDYCNMPFEKRWNEIEDLFYSHDKWEDDGWCNNSLYDNKYMYPTEMYYDNFSEVADQIISAGGEGLVIQRRDNPYMPGTRTAWKTLKLKQHMDSAEYLVIGTVEPNKRYNGICLESWHYWEQPNKDGENELIYIEKPNAFDFEVGVPVTKPYFYGWKNGITIMLPSGIKTDVSSGLTDEDCAWLATEEAQTLIEKGELYAEVKAMSINDKGALRHAYVVRLRTTSDGANQ